MFITSTDNFGQTPLHLAVKDNRVEMAKCLLNEGASPDETDFTDTSLLQSAVQDGSREIVLLLYPQAKSSLALITASDWQKHLISVSCCDLEVIDGEEAQVHSIDNLKDHVSKLSYPIPSFSITGCGPVMIGKYLVHSRTIWNFGRRRIVVSEVRHLWNCLIAKLNARNGSSSLAKSGNFDNFCIASILECVGKPADWFSGCVVFRRALKV